MSVNGFTEEWFQAHQAKMARIIGSKGQRKAAENVSSLPVAGKTPSETGKGEPEKKDTPQNANLEFYEKRSKYGSNKVTIDGIRFDSEKEGNRYLELKAMEQAGEISDLQLQVAFVLAPPVILKGRKKPALRYVADFTYLQNGVKVIEDTKSWITRKLPVYRVKLHLMKSVCGVDIRET